MVELKSKNLFIKKGNGAIYTISKIIDFYDLIGLNVLYMSYKGATLGGLLKCSKRNFTPSAFSSILSENLFRVDVIIVDPPESNFNSLYFQARKLTQVPVIFVANIRDDDLDLKNPKGMKLSDFETAYLFSKGDSMSGTLQSLQLGWVSSSDKLEDYVVEELKEGWVSNLKNLKVQYIRDKNLRDLLGDVD